MFWTTILRVSFIMIIIGGVTILLYSTPFIIMLVSSAINSQTSYYLKLGSQTCHHVDAKSHKFVKVIILLYEYSLLLAGPHPSFNLIWSQLHWSFVTASCKAVTPLQWQNLSTDQQFNAKQSLVYLLPIMTHSTLMTNCVSLSNSS